MNIWPVIENLVGKTLTTLAQDKPFEILKVSNNEVVILIHSTNKERKIQKKNIENAAKYLFSHRTLTRKQIRKLFSEPNPAYIAVILSKLPGVIYENRPITLIYRN